MSEFGRGPIEVPTLRADARLSWVMLAILLADLVLIGSRLSWPLRTGAWALGVAAVVATFWGVRRTAGTTPVRVTPTGLQLPGGDGGTLEIDWADIAGFALTRRLLLPVLLVEPTDPDRVRPAPNPWQRAAATHRDGYRLRAYLGGDRTNRARLREALAARIPVTDGRP